MIIIIIDNDGYIFESFVDFVIAWKDGLDERLDLDEWIVNGLLSFIHVSEGCDIWRVPHGAFHVRLGLVGVVGKLVCAVYGDVSQIYGLVNVAALEQSYESGSNILIHLQPICNNPCIQIC